MTIFLFYSCCTSKRIVHYYAILLCLFLLFKWITDYRLCTLSYLEIKVRNVSKEEGLLYNFLENLIDFNKSDCRYFLYFIIFCILLKNIYMIQKKNIHIRYK